MILSGTTLSAAVKKRRSGKWFPVLCLAVLLLSGCAMGGTDHPPAADTPEPPPHDGVFQSDCGTLTFNGDGESISVQFEEDFARQAALPEGAQQGTYAFTFSHGLYRYDKAEHFCIYIGDNSYSFQNRWQETGENVICLASPLAAGETIRFEKATAGSQ